MSSLSMFLKVIMSLLTGTSTIFGSSISDGADTLSSIAEFSKEPLSSIVQQSEEPLSSIMKFGSEQLSSKKTAADQDSKSGSSKDGNKGSSAK
ncbi:hypothetical protein [Corynebacterium cystitidis]|uniref:Uncharacterized protein n=1 Tax=Corynebacterium cystitidis DSM 20524 TaxID=1121357 RepID=A0A1H9VCY3_9CORY|nr:hypothetical protein [Corynebacterium cystitidis]WJY82306.1 hypothetical protein CCYS_06890 [Corynebacterium cystitidis DSM 20524]SES19077.1 hypothetical protein SAMN05661109_02164 [Corynebacterium cystitidis DSM 20524]SNV76615.1 Uncharacterised protein [Corynebacterium cystitidis]